MNIQAETVTINGVDYVRADQVQQSKLNGNRAVFVVDRGWVFAGDVTEENGRIRISRAVHVVRWESIGFSGMIEAPKSNKVTLKPITDIDLPATSEIYRIPVSDEWGL